MRVSPRMLQLVAALAFVAVAAGAEPKAYQAEGVSFVLPGEWKVQATPEKLGAGVVFIGEGGEGGRLTIARLPPLPAKPLPSALDAMAATETAEMRIALEEAGLSPASGVATSIAEGGATLETAGFRCKAPAGREVTVLSATWRTAGQAVRARLQFSESPSPKAGAELDAIRGSVRFRSARTLGFGTFQMARTGPPENADAWARLVGTPVPAAAEPLPPAAPTLAATLPAPAFSPAPDTGRIVQDFRGSLVFIESGPGAGSGFMCQMKDGTFLLTNQHVVAGMPTVHLTRLDRTPVAAGAMTAAVGHDIMRFALAPGTEARPLVAMENVEKEARIGDDIVVLGNSEGARVIQPLTGKLLGLGPDRVEVSAEFVPGNSGSPIIHVASGRVIGIATYLMQRRFKELGDPGQGSVRRFGYRLDSVKQWQPVHWPTFQAEHAAVDRVTGVTRDLARLIGDMNANTPMTGATYSTPSIARNVRDLDAILTRRGLAKPDRVRAFQTFVAGIRTVTQADLAQVRPTLRYDYFQRALGEEGEVREEMYQLFDRLLKQKM